MGKRYWRMWCSLALVMVMAIAAGCQAIGGIDLNKVLLSSMLEVNSMEGSSSVTIEFMLDDKEVEDRYNAEELALLKSINPLKLNMDRVKMENREKMSVSGSLEITRGKIPFTASITPEELVLKPEGAAKPLVLKLDELAQGPALQGGGLDGMYGPSPEQQAITKELEAKFKEPAFLKPIYSYFLNGMPNPKNIKLSNVSETINGESVSLHKVEASLVGTEMVPWLKSYLVKLMQDDQGLKSVVALLYDTIKPVLDKAKAEAGDSIIHDSEEEMYLYSDSPFGAMGSFGDTLANLMSDRDTAIEVLHTEAKQVMVVLLGLLSQPETEEDSLIGFMSDKTHVKGSIYIDNSLKVRKSEAEILVTAPEGMPNDGVKAVKVTASSSNWNVNKEVKADIIPSAGGLELGFETEPTDVLEQLDSSSVLYQWLKKDLHVTRKTVVFYPEAYNFMPPSMLTYSEKGTTMVPARHLAESLGASIDWNGAKQSVTITDKRTGAVIVTVVGSAEAKVNGKAVELEAPATIKEGTLYVPLRFVSEALGAEVHWSKGNGLITVTVE